LIWADAQGCRVVDADGREYLDLSGGFGVAALGHRNPQVLAAWREQRVVHALGDLAEAEVTVELRRRLPWPAKLGVTGEDAVEIALRTALIATGKPGILAFEGAYHGTGLLALAATLDRRFSPALSDLAAGSGLPAPLRRRPGHTACALRLRDRRAGAGARRRAGAVTRLPPRAPPSLHRAWGATHRRCDLRRARPHRRALAGSRVRRRAGRSARRSATGCRSRQALFCREELEHVWELGEEDVYTHTHTGSPLASAAALVVLEEVPKLLERVQEAGERFEREGWHGKGLLRAREGDADEALRRGVIVVPAGPGGRLISATPPLTITDAELDEAFSLL
jgi:4-aminobutyrate aminotransferase/(S)-3-amino-2-methylpropionate transaminase